MKKTTMIGVSLLLTMALGACGSEEAINGDVAQSMSVVESSEVNVKETADEITQSVTETPESEPEETKADETKEDVTEGTDESGEIEKSEETEKIESDESEETEETESDESDETEETQNSEAGETEEAHNDVSDVTERVGTEETKPDNKQEDKTEITENAGTTQRTLASEDHTVSFIAILNAKRQEAGLNPVRSADSAYIQSVMQDAEYVYNNYSHDSVKTECSYCNIGSGQKSIEEIFNDWWESPGHKNAMMAKDLDQVACASYGVSGRPCTWVFCGTRVEKTEEEVRQEIEEQKENGELVRIDDSEEDDGIEVWGSPGVTIVPEDEIPPDFWDLLNS